MQNEILRRSKKVNEINSKITVKNLNDHAFKHKIECGICGKNYRRKTYASGTKYEKPIWICSTFNTYGKQYCPSGRIPEETIEKLACEVLGITKFDEKIFSNNFVFPSL